MTSNYTYQFHTYPFQQQPVVYDWGYYAMSSVPRIPQERTTMIDTKKLKFHILNDNGALVGHYETLEEAKKAAAKKVADDKGGTYTVFQAILQIEAKPLDVIETPIP